MEKLGGLILAAGMSSRMGAFKPLLPIGGRTMIRRVADLMTAAGAHPIVVVTGHRHERIEEHLADSGVLFVHNPDYAHTQMLDSLRLGIRALQGHCDRVMMSPADVPLASPSTVERLLEQDAAFIRPMYEGRPGHPVILGPTLLPLILTYEGEGGLGGLVKSRPADEICQLHLDDPGAVMDADLPQDYANLLRLWDNTHSHEKREPL